MKLKVKSAAVAIAAALATGIAGATGTTAGTSDAGRSVLGESPHSANTTSVYAIDEAEFQRLDDDKDGRLSRNETRELSGLQQDWANADADGDAYLSREELARYHAEGGSKATASPSSAPLTEPPGAAGATAPGR